MRLSIPLLICLLSATAAGVQPTETTLAGHVIGESFQEWMRVNNLVLSDTCGPHKRSDKAMDYKSVCQSLDAFRVGLPGDFVTKDQKGRTITWTFSHAEVSEAATSHTLDFLIDGLRDSPSSAQEQLRFMVEAYGQPSEMRPTRQWDTFTSQWEDLFGASWLMRDGALIIAHELMTPTREGFIRTFEVHFYSKQRLLDLAREGKSKPNPYSDQPTVPALPSTSISTL